jgi:hypothetical protein
MASEIKSTGVDPEVLADIDALMRHLSERTPVDPELSRRANKRADRVIDRLREKQVEIDIEKLLREVRDES